MLCSLLAILAQPMILISIRVSVLSFSHEAVKSMFHTQMRWVSPSKPPCSSDPSPLFAWFAGFPLFPFPRLWLLLGCNALL